MLLIKYWIFLSVLNFIALANVNSLIPFHKISVHYFHFTAFLVCFIQLFFLQEITQQNEFLKQRFKDKNEDVARLENIADSLVFIQFLHFHFYHFCDLKYLFSAPVDECTVEAYVECTIFTLSSKVFFMSPKSFSVYICSFCLHQN